MSGGAYHVISEPLMSDLKIPSATDRGSLITDLKKRARSDSNTRPTD